MNVIRFVRICAGLSCQRSVGDSAKASGWFVGGLRAAATGVREVIRRLLYLLGNHVMIVSNGVGPGGNESCRAPARGCVRVRLIAR